MTPTDYFGDDYQPAMLETAKPAWTLQDVYSDLAIPDDVAKALNVTYSRVASWIRYRKKNGSPEPVRTFAGVNVYSIAEWQAWFDVWLRKHAYSKQVTEIKPHGSGTSFWSYFDDKKDD